MTKHIMYICYAYPPANVIGAVRPFQQVQYFLSIGYKVTVICAETDSQLSHDFDHPNLKLIRYENRISRILRNNSKGIDQKIIYRALKFGARKLFYPDDVIISKSKILRIVKDVVKHDGKPDVIISSSLPFSLHKISSEISSRYNIKWIADQRDLWATSPYRKTIKYLRLLDQKYEKKVLKNAVLNTVVGNRMKSEFEKTTGFDNVVVIRNGADSNNAINNYKLDSERIIFSYTGSLYSGFRDPTDLFEALLLEPTVSTRSVINFYGSERTVVDDYIKKYLKLRIQHYEKKPKTEIKKIQKESHFLVIALGKSDFEKSVLTGKFYEYLESGRPIIALCDEDSELAALINSLKLGIATRNHLKIISFINNSKKCGFPMIEIPYELTREYQNNKLNSYILGIS